MDDFIRPPKKEIKKETKQRPIKEILIVILGFDIVLLNRKPLIDQMKMYAYVLLIFFLRNKIMSEFYL